MKKKTIEEKAAEVILQRPMEVVVGERTYTVAQPSVATLILVSEQVSTLPRIVTDAQKVVEESLSIAKDCKAVGDIAAILILGARHLTETEETEKKAVKRYLWGLVRRETVVVEEKVVNRKEQLARELLETYTPKELYLLVASLLQRMEIADFFGLTTFLIEINLMRPTKVETEATVSGQ